MLSVRESEMLFFLRVSRTAATSIRTVINGNQSYPARFLINRYTVSIRTKSTLHIYVMKQSTGIIIF